MKKLKLSLGLLIITSLSFGQLIPGSFSWDGQVRDYELFIPASYDEMIKTPLVLALHGLGDTGGGFVNFIRMNPVANRENFIVVYPTALPDPFLMGNGWNVGLNPTNTTDDVGFLAAMIDSIEAKYQIDADRIYVTGFSLGGFMTNKLGCEIGERVAAIASLSGTIPATLINGCEPADAIPSLHMHGTADGTIPYNNAPIFGLIQNVGADSTSSFWANHNGCISPPTEEQIPDTENDGYTIAKSTYGGCNDSSEVLLYTITGAPHTILQQSNDLSAAEEVWAFFSRHKKRRPTGLAPMESSNGKINIYPNPFGSAITIDMNESNLEELSVVDALGKEVAIRRDIAFFQSLSLETDQLKPGIYFLRLKSSKNTFVRKIVKSN